MQHEDSKKGGSKNSQNQENDLAPAAARLRHLTPHHQPHLLQIFICESHGPSLKLSSLRSRSETTEN
jgi:hypothetical protein